MLTDLAYAAVYALVGIALLAVGFAVLDVATPGSLRRHLVTSPSAAAIVASAFLGLSAVVFTAIWTNGDSSLGHALLATTGFGLLGVLLQVVSFFVLELAVPGPLREVVAEPTLRPTAVVAGALMIGVSAIICASIA